MTLLNVTDISCARGEQSLFENLSFSLTAKQCLHIRGANGSGKTSLLRILSGLLAPTAGKLRWQANTSFAYLAHKDGLKNELSAIENMRFFQKLGSRETIPKKQSEDRLDHALNALGLLNKADKPTKSLSFGQRRRLAFARLLLNEEKIWILDEPLTGVDTHGRQLIEELCLNHLSNGGGILISHHGDLSTCSFANHVSTVDLS